jgi:hypothetical protein
VSADEYLKTFDVKLPEDFENQHAVFRHQLEDGTEVLVPALAFMRGFFKPHKLLLPVVFTPSNVDLLGFVDYSACTPVFIQDFEPEKYIARADIAGRYLPLRWLHSSLSAHRCAHSVHRHSCQGSLDLDLPAGLFRLVLRGIRVGSTLFVNKVTVVSVTVPTVDSIADTKSLFTLHLKADAARTVAACSVGIYVPSGLDGTVNLTDSEWMKVEPLLQGKRIGKCVHSQRDLLDGILRKLATGCTWKEVTNRKVELTTLTSKFRIWKLDGRLATVLAALEVSRTTPR